MPFTDFHMLWNVSAHCILKKTLRVKLCNLQVWAKVWDSEEVSGYTSQSWAAQNGERRGRWERQSLEGVGSRRTSRVTHKEWCFLSHHREGRESRCHQQNPGSGTCVTWIESRIQKAAATDTSGFIWTSLQQGNRCPMLCFSVTRVRDENPRFPPMF